MAHISLCSLKMIHLISVSYVFLLKLVHEVTMCVCVLVLVPDNEAIV